MKATLRSFASIAILVLACTASARARDDDTNAIDDTPHVTIVGSARTEVAPDLATITLGVTSEKPTAREASDEAAKLARAVVAAAKAQGVGAGDIATQVLTLTQTFDETHDASGRFTGQKPRGFAAADTFVIRIRDLARAGTVAQGLIEAGANRFDGIAFSVEHPEPILDRLAAEAVRDARRRAQLVAEAAGVKLGPVLLVERPGADRGSAPPVFAARMKASALPIEPGSTEMSSEMEITWSIER